MRANYHTHSTYCDGKASPAEMAEAARAAGYAILGFSSHAPLPFPTSWAMKEEVLGSYAAEIRALAAEWSGRGLEILLGLEIDYLEGLRKPTDAVFDGLDLDYRIASVHYVQPGGRAFTVDCPEAEFEAHMEADAGGDGTRLYRDYYRRLAAAVEEGGFDILGHFDLVARNNRGGRWFDEGSAGYLSAAAEVVALLAESGAVVEVNLGAMNRGTMTTPHPSLPIMRLLREKSVPVTFSADAHRPEHLGMNIEAAKTLARAAGYGSIALLGTSGWREAGIDEA